MKLLLPLGFASLVGLIGLTGCVVADGPTTYVDAPPPPPPPPPPDSAPPSETVYTPPGTYASAPTYASDDYDSGDAPTPDEGEVQVQTVQDFDEPLQPYGEWITVGSYGRCWRPSHVDRDWRPYCVGHWEDSDRGWYWASDEPWGWATYHYGRWDLQPGFGWVWVPHTRWAPAWVAWRSGGGYVGWAPLPPGARFGNAHEIRNSNAPDRAFVFVQERRFNEHLRPSAVVINNPTIIHQTTNITNITIVNNRVRNGGPRAEVIEKASGHPIHPVAAVQLRRQIEQPVALQHPMLTHPHANPAANNHAPQNGSRPNEVNRRMGSGPVDPAVHAGPGLPPKHSTQHPEVSQPHPAQATTPNPVVHSNATYHNELTPHPTNLPLHHDNAGNQLHAAPTLNPLPSQAHPSAAPRFNPPEHVQTVRPNPSTVPPKVDHSINPVPAQRREGVVQQPRPVLHTENPVVVQHPAATVQTPPQHNGGEHPNGPGPGPNGRGPAVVPPKAPVAPKAREAQPAPARTRDDTSNQTAPAPK